MNRFLGVIISFATAFSIHAATPAVEELPLPEVPATLTSPGERAAFIVTHFWDKMDFSDTIRSHDTTFMEQNFVNYLSIFPVTDKAVLKKSVPELMKRAESDTTAYCILADMADKYLYDAESPMLDEEAYIIFLEAITGSDFMESVRKKRFEYELNDALKNRKGHKAADFPFIDSKGNNSSLYSSMSGTKKRVLIFYDPDCEHCEEVITKLNNDVAFNKMIDEGSIDVLAVYAEGDTEVWNRAKGLLPQKWNCGYSPDNQIESSELYVLRRTPTLFLLDSDNTVILKDTSAEQILDFFNPKKKYQ